MKRVQKTVLLWYSAPEMYQLVTDVPAYPTFLPWCAKAEVLAQDASGMQARLHLAYAGVKHAFTTRNLHDADRQLTITLVDGPFSMLDGVWKFTPVDAQACRIDFDLRYAFASPVLEAVVSPVFDRIAATFVDAFVKRAESVYGQR
jgi:ribosome-associated toxin RatA of RatAB toxin-antitoxin module